MIVGLDQFSYHRFFGDVFTNWENDPGVCWNLDDFLRRGTSRGINCRPTHALSIRS